MLSNTFHKSVKQYLLQESEKFQNVKKDMPIKKACISKVTLTILCCHNRGKGNTVSTFNGTTETKVRKAKMIH